MLTFPAVTVLFIKRKARSRLDSDRSEFFSNRPRVVGYAVYSTVYVNLVNIR